MPIRIAANAGFCMGVSRAVSQALEAVRQAKAEGLQAFSLGELIHNPAVVASLREQGLEPVDSPEAAAGGVLVIRSHGVSQDVIAQCRLHAEKTVDCTCPFVHHVHRLVHDFSREGAPVIILGNPLHPEIRGIVGWCQGDKHVVQDEADVAALPESAGNALVVSQTTLSPATSQALTAALGKRFPGLTFESTICRATSDRQTEAEELARQADRMIVVGGRDSANTQKLAETCRRYCPETYLIQDAAELDRYPMDPARELIGITAGASTPAWSLKEVVDRMNDMEHKDQAQEPILPENAEQAAQELKDGAQEMVEETLHAAEETAADAVESAEEAVESVSDGLEAAAEETVAAAEDSASHLAQEAEKALEAPHAEEPAAAAPAEQPAPQPAKAPSFMDEVAASIARIRNGQTVTGKVVQLTDDEVCVNIGYKSDGLLKRDELVDKDVQLGDEIEVEIVKVNDGEGNVILSQRNIVNRKVWNDLMEKYHQGELVDGVGKEAVKGGLLATVDGVRAFIPASHLAQRYVEKISQFVGQDMKLKIIEVDESKKRIVASRKEALAIENEAVKDAVWSKLEEGAVVKGIVRRFTNFGAFVDLGGVDGLIHVSDLSWNRTVSPSDVLHANEEVEVKILSLDRERERIALGYKQLQARPWDNVEEKYPVGTVLTRKIVRVRPFGAFIELEPGVDGLVHISQVSHTRVERIEDAISPGQEVNVKVLAVDPVAKRISLSIKEAMEDSAMNYHADIPGEYADAQHPANQDGGDYLPAVPAAETERQETTLELAMRKAREELEAQENRENGEE